MKNFDFALLDIRTGLFYKINFIVISGRGMKTFNVDGRNDYLEVGWIELIMYTKMIDNSKAKNKIYEFDILKTEIGIGVVEFFNGAFWFRYGKRKKELLFNVLKNSKVIGNRYEILSNAKNIEFVNKKWRQ